MRQLVNDIRYSSEQLCKLQNLKITIAKGMHIEEKTKAGPRLGVEPPPNCLGMHPYPLRQHQTYIIEYCKRDNYTATTKERHRISIRKY